jgi:enamine deaminase RidA (YjgF/YER057c/UK114 family)
MTKEIINPASLPTPRGFNHGLLTTGGKLLFLAGQDASDGEGHIVAPGDIVAQCQQALHNLHAVVHEAGGQMTDIVKLNVYVTSRDAYVEQLKPLGKLFREYFGAYYPAMALFEVVGLFQPEAMIEMEGFAVLGAEEQG